MKFEQFLNEKLADDLTPDQMDKYWKAIHAYNSWKKNKKNSMKVKNQLAYIYHEFPLDDRAKGKIRSLIDTIATYLETGEDTTVIKHREQKETPAEAKPVEVEYDASDYQEFELTQDFLEKAFNKFNEKYFENKLAPIPLKIVEMAENGKFTYVANYYGRKFDPIEIKINPNCNQSFSLFRNVLVHEMLHYYVHTYYLPDEDTWAKALCEALRGKRKKSLATLGCSDSTCHGGDWLKLAKKLNSTYKELAITRNTFISYNDNKDKLNVIEQLKDAYIVDYYYKSWGGHTQHNEMIMTSQNFNKLYEVIKIHRIKLTDENYRELEDFFNLYNINVYNGATGYLKYGKIENPIAIASFPIRDLNTVTVNYLGDNMYKQILHTKAVKMKEFGQIHFYEEPKTEIEQKTETKTESTELDFKTWLNEKTNPKWDLKKLKALGLSDEEIEALLNGEANEVCSIS